MGVHHDCPTSFNSLRFGFEGQPAVTAAVESGHMHVVCWLYANGEEPEPMHYMLAARFGRLDLLQWLHAHGVPLDLHWFASACMSAAGTGHLVELQWLLRPDRPAEHLLPAAKLEQGLGLATSRGHVAVRQYLRTFGPAVSY
jgi:hypothetical protein